MKGMFVSRIEVRLPKCKIQSVSVMDGTYSVNYWSGRERKFTTPPTSVLDFVERVSKEHWEVKYKNVTKEFDVYRNYVLKEE